MGAPASTPGQIPNYTPGVDYVGSQNLPSPPTRIYPPPPFYCDYVKCIWLPEYTSPSKNIPPFQQIYATFPEYTPSQNIPPFSTIICDPPRIYSSLPEYMPYPPFQQLYATLPESTPPSQNIPPFLTTICDPPRIYPSLPEYTPFSMSAICHPPTIYPSLPEYTPLFNNYMRPSQKSTHPSQNIPPFSTTTRLCDPPRICPSLLESFSVLGASGRFSHNYKSV